MSKSIVTPASMNSIVRYNDTIDIVIMLMLLVPLTIVFILIIGYANDKRVYQFGVSQRRNARDEGELSKLTSIIGEIDEKCKNNIRWVYSRKYLDPIYSLCDIKTVDDCYKWLVCMKPDICPRPESYNVSYPDCSTLRCKYT